MGAWFSQHQRAAGIGVAALAVVLLGIAGLLGWALFANRPSSTADLGSSSQPSANPSSPSASATPSSELTATPEPTFGFEAPAGVLPPNSRAKVIVDVLQVRDGAGLNAAVLDTLQAGTVVELALGWTDPVTVDGIDWYHVTYDGDAAGTVAAGVGADRYLQLLPPRCEDGDPDLAALHVTDWERLACFGSRSLTVTGTYGCPVCGIAYPRGGYEPRWLANPDTLSYLTWQGGEVTLHFPPEPALATIPNASIVRVTGHFNDPTSSTCTIKPTMDGFPAGPEVDPVIAELWCREQFVVDAFEIIGTDPDFTYSFPPQLP